MSEADIDAQLRKESGGGASITMRDPRLSQLANWGLGVLGLAVVAIGAWIATSINELTLTITRASDRIEVIASRQTQSENRNEAWNERQDLRLNSVEKDVAVVNGKVFRGVAGYEITEPVRGR